MVGRDPVPGLSPGKLAKSHGRKWHRPSSKRAPPGPPTSARSTSEVACAQCVFFCLVLSAFIYVASTIFHELAPADAEHKQVHKGSPKWIAAAAAQRFAYTARALDAHALFAPKDVLIIAHRGCTGRFPENSLPAIAACAEEGAQLAEVDLDVTADGHIVLARDATLARTTNAAHWTTTTTTETSPGADAAVQATPTEALTLDEVRSVWLTLSESSGASTPWKVPTFAEAIHVARACGVHLVLDSRRRAGVVARLAAELNATDGWDVVVLGPAFEGEALGALATAAKNAGRRLRAFPTFATEDDIRAWTCATSEDDDDDDNDACAGLRRGSNASAVPVAALNVPRTPRTTSKTGGGVSVAAWVPVGSAATDYDVSCALRQRGTGTTANFLWSEGGEYFIRDPRRVAEVWPNVSASLRGRRNATRVAARHGSQGAAPAAVKKTTSILDEPCVDAKSHNVACFGAHLYIRPLKATCARAALTDMPTALRAALVAFDMAPPSRSPDRSRPATPLAWPLDPVKPPPPGARSTSLPAPPKCFDLSRHHHHHIVSAASLVPPVAR